MKPNRNTLHFDLDHFVSWCSSFYFLQQNISNCKVITLYKSFNLVENSYLVNNTNLVSISTFNDLGGIFDRELSFSLHVDTTIPIRFRLLGFIKMSIKHIQDTTVITCLYNGLSELFCYCSIAVLFGL